MGVRTRVTVAAAVLLVAAGAVYTVESQRCDECRNIRVEATGTGGPFRVRLSVTGAKQSLLEEVDQVYVEGFARVVQVQPGEVVTIFLTATPELPEGRTTMPSRHAVTCVVREGNRIHARDGKTTPVDDPPVPALCRAVIG